MSRKLTFQELAELVDSSAAVILDHDALTYPYVVYNEDDGEDETEVNGIHHFEINFIDHFSGDSMEFSFYPDECSNMQVNDDGSLSVSIGDEEFNIQILQVQLAQ